MILVLAVAAGLIAGLGRAWIGKRRIYVPSVRLTWLVIIAFLAQALVFQLPEAKSRIPEPLISAVLVGTQVLLLIFAGFNLKHKGFWALGLGLLLNFMAITLNGGWMPISPQTVAALLPNAKPGAWQVNARLGTSKDRVIEESITRLNLLSDRFLLPPWFPFHVAFSIGDVMIAIGAFLFLWSLGDRPAPSQS